jgi:hypothetical protein
MLATAPNDGLERTSILLRISELRIGELGSVGFCGVCGRTSHGTIYPVELEWGWIPQGFRV